MSTRAWVLALSILALAGCEKGSKKGKGTGPTTAVKAGVPGAEKKGVLSLTSSAFKPGERIPRKYTGEAEDVSPPLAWAGTPEGTKELALICDDPDAPTSKPFVHWVLYRIAADRTSLAEGDPGGALEGKNGFGDTGYGGPMPPPGHGVHHYYFRLYALDTKLDLNPGATKEELLAATEGHILAEGELIGTYERK